VVDCVVCDLIVGAVVGQKAEFWICVGGGCGRYRLVCSYWFSVWLNSLVWTVFDFGSFVFIVVVVFWGWLACFGFLCASCVMM